MIYFLLQISQVFIIDYSFEYFKHCSLGLNELFLSHIVAKKLTLKRNFFNQKQIVLTSIDANRSVASWRSFLIFFIFRIWRLPVEHFRCYFSYF